MWISMALKSQNITLDQLPEVFVSNLALTALVSREVRNAHLRKLGSRVYTKNLKEAPELNSQTKCLDVGGRFVSRRFNRGSHCS